MKTISGSLRRSLLGQAGLPADEKFDLNTLRQYESNGQHKDAEDRSWRWTNKDKLNGTLEKFCSIESKSV
jgi:hypothetical protein